MPSEVVRRSAHSRAVIQGLQLVFAGILAGLAASIPVAALMLTWEFIVPTGAGSTSPLSMLGQPIVYAELAVVLAIAVLASLVPARRALRVDPAVALRHE